MLSLTPFFSDNFAPAMSTCNFYDNPIERDLARLHSIINDEPSGTHLQPNYSLVESGEQAHLEVELPGVAKENINIHISGNKLVITGKRFRAVETVKEKPAMNSEDEKKGTREEEHPTPSVVYQLNLRLGNRYDTNNVHATMDGNGILKMAVPKKKKESSRKIEIE